MCHFKQEDVKLAAPQTRSQLNQFSIIISVFIKWTLTFTLTGVIWLLCSAVCLLSGLFLSFSKWIVFREREREKKKKKFNELMEWIHGIPLGTEAHTHRDRLNDTHIWCSDWSRWQHSASEQQHAAQNNRINLCLLVKYWLRYPSSHQVRVRGMLHVLHLSLRTVTSSIL